MTQIGIVKTPCFWFLSRTDFLDSRLSLSALRCGSSRPLPFKSASTECWHSPRFHTVTSSLMTSKNLTLTVCSLCVAQFTHLPLQHPVINISRFCIVQHSAGSHCCLGSKIRNLSTLSKLIGSLFRYSFGSTPSFNSVIFNFSR